MSRKPDYQLAFLNKATENKGNVGVGWANEDGSIGIRLNTMVHLFQSPDTVLTLFPIDHSKKSKKAEQPEHERDF